MKKRTYLLLKSPTLGAKIVLGAHLRDLVEQIQKPNHRQELPCTKSHILLEAKYLGPDSGCATLPPFTLPPTPPDSLPHPQEHDLCQGKGFLKAHQQCPIMPPEEPCSETTLIQTLG